MTRPNPRIEQLERENAFLRRHIDDLRREPADIPFGAGDNSCICARATGMHTNGGCRCDEKRLRTAVGWWRRRAEFLQITIIEMRNVDAVKQYDETVAVLEMRRTDGGGK